MAQFYTLEEAANRLGIAPDEFKRRLKLEWTSIRPFRDGATLRFRAADIDELARSLGAASDPGLPLGPVGTPPAEESAEFAPPPLSDKPKNAKRPAPDEPLGLDTGDDDLALPIADPNPKAKTGSDSDVRLDSARGRAAPDPESALPTEEIALDLSSDSGRHKPGSSAKLSAPKSGAKLSGPESAKIPSPSSSPPDKSDSSSEFELSLDADSDSFELQMAADSSDEVDLGSADGADGKGGQSGINLGKPSDSGVSLEKKKGGKPGPTQAGDDSDVDFELSLDPTGASGVRLGGPKSAPKKPAGGDSSSEFELTLDEDSGVVDRLAAESRPSGEQGKGDIFETDFELPVMEDESGSEVVAVDGADTDLESTGFEVDINELDAPVDDESASQVVLVDNDDAPLIDEDATGEALTSEEDEDVLAGADLDDGPSASKALRGVRDQGDGAPSEVRTVVATPPKWGPLPAVVLLPTLVVMFLGMLMSFEILMGMRGYSEGSPAGGTLVRGVADIFGMKVND